MKKLLTTLLLALPVVSVAFYDHNAIEAYENGQITYNQLPDSSKKYVNKIDSVRGETGRIDEALRFREHINDSIVFNDQFEEFMVANNIYREVLEGYYRGEVEYKNLPDSLKDDVLKFDMPIVTNGMRNHKPAKKAQLVRGTMVRMNSRSEFKGDNMRDEVRSYREGKGTKYRPTTSKNYDVLRAMPRANTQSFTPTNVTQKEFLNRRSYYFWDKRDEQAADSVRARARLRSVHVPSFVNAERMEMKKEVMMNAEEAEMEAAMEELIEQVMEDMMDEDPFEIVEEMEIEYGEPTI